MSKRFDVGITMRQTYERSHELVIRVDADDQPEAERLALLRLADGSHDKRIARLWSTMPLRLVGDANTISTVREAR